MTILAKINLTDRQEGRSANTRFALFGKKYKAFAKAVDNFSIFVLQMPSNIVSLN